MPFALFAHMYQMFQLRCARTFEEHHHVLSLQEIDAIIKDPRRELSLKVIESAVIDHGAVEGKTYYLSHPHPPLFANDGHKRAVLAEAIPNLADGLAPQDRERAKRILEKFIAVTEIGYVQVLAWHSLAQLVQEEGADPGMYSKPLMDSFSHTTASVLGALLYLEKFLGTADQSTVEGLLKEGSPRVVYALQRVILHLFLAKHPVIKRSFINPSSAKESSSFIESLENRLNFNGREIHEGLRLIGLLEATSEPVLWENTSQKRVADALIIRGRDYLGAIGAYLEKY